MLVSFHFIAFYALLYFCVNLFCFLHQSISIFMDLCFFSFCLSFCSPLCPTATSENFLSIHLFWVPSTTMSSPHRGRQTELSPSWLVLSRLHHLSPSVWTHKTHTHTLFQGLGSVSMRVQPLPFNPRRKDSKFSLCCCLIHVISSSSALCSEFRLNDQMTLISLCCRWTLHTWSSLIYFKA